MLDNNKCVFCDNNILYKHDGDLDIFLCNCPNCGKYNITYEAVQDIPYYLKKFHSDKKHLISGYLREMTDLCLPVELITTDNYQNLISSSKIPRTTIEKLDKLLSYIYRRTNYLYEIIEIDDNYPAIAYAKTSVELENMIGALLSLNYLQFIIQTKPYGYRLTLSGIERAEVLQQKVSSSMQGFVAMWFDKSMINIYDNFISKAIIDSGYNPLIISQKEHNDKICDEIIAEIKRSKFLIADFTGQRGGVYFEAGFAYGLNIPVIWTCQEDDLVNVHFDINHYNFIVWKDGDDLYKKLKNRILATILSE